MQALIHVQHLLGVGHLQRAAAIAAALHTAGFAVTLASGGKSAPRALVPGIEFYQLPPVSSTDGSFSELLDDTGSPIDDAWRARRAECLLQLYDRIAPDVLITEGFPFARRMLRFELLPLLERAREDRHCRLIVSSVRDILQPKSRPERNAETLEWIDSYYDRVLVHGDQELARLDYSFAPAARIAARIAYTGYIAVDTDFDSCDGPGDSLLQNAILARSLSSLAARPWRILVSPSIDAGAFDELQAMADAGIAVERNRKDFPALLARARLSISQAGYNTVTDLLRTRTPAVLVPFAEAGEREQTLRAELLRQRRRVAVVSALLNCVSLDLHLDGANRSAELIQGWLKDMGYAA